MLVGWAKRIPLLLNCALQSADILRWCFHLYSNLTQNLFFLFPIVCGINLFPAKQKTTWLSSLKLCEKINAENEKLNVFLQQVDVWESFSIIKFVKSRHFQYENEKKCEKSYVPAWERWREKGLLILSKHGMPDLWKSFSLQKVASKHYTITNRVYMILEVI